MLNELQSGIPAQVVTMIVAMIPILELRGAIPLAVFTLGLPAWEAFLWAVLGNSVAGTIVVLFLEPVSKILRRLDAFDRFFEWLFERTRRRHARSFEGYQALALFVFVAIPLPMTGAWSGAAAAFVFGMKRRTAVPAVVLGVVAAGLAVVLVTTGTVHLGGFLADLIAPKRV